VASIRHYLTPDGKDVYQAWYEKLRDVKARIAIDRRINRLELDNFGDCKSLKGGLWELRIDTGPGYRIYYAIAGAEIVLLLLGGDKQTQRADIARARDYWLDWQERN
jgi:putative addiction module killer protein